MRIGELATRTGVSVRSLRYYEEQGLLSAERSPSGQRLYREYDVERVHYLQRMYAAGLSSSTILDLLPCVESPGEHTADAAFDRLLEERDRLEAHIADLIATRESLDVLIERNRDWRRSLDEPAAQAG